jgi:hypothetical protein
MNRRDVVFGLVALVFGSAIGAIVFAGEGKAALRLIASQTDFLRLEPILVTVNVAGDAAVRLPASPGGESASNQFRFEIEPAVKPRPEAKPLPSEARVGTSPKRKFDLLEWFQFPDSGTFTVRAVFEHDGSRYASEPIRVTIRNPAKGDAEFDAVARLHHMPWSNYDTNAFCGDTFDVVKNWPESRLARYCHYWNGRYSQGKKEFDKAIASYQTVINRYPGFVLADDARQGIAECKAAQAKK